MKIAIMRYMWSWKGKFGVINLRQGIYALLVILAGVQYISHKIAGMGIQGLLKLLEPITIKDHISSFRNQTAAIDMMSWIYKGCYRCAFEHNQNIESNEFLYYILEMLELLSYYNIKPICVFDGRYVGKKDQTIEKRKKIKEENKKRGLELLDQGNEEEARKYLSRCIIIDDRIITLTINALHTKGIQYMVAPYESDSQIAKLVHLGVAHFAITEDSDLIVYNVRVMLKLSQDGDCDCIDISKWQPKDVDTAYLKLFLKMTHITRVDSAILAGSDYNSSIKGIGIKKAIKHLSQRKTINGVIDHLRKKATFCERIPQNYEAIVLDSKLIFSFATIYNPISGSLQFLNPHLIDEIKPAEMDLQDLKKIVGPYYDYNNHIRLGRINARTLQSREIKKIQFKNVFSANIYNLNIRENANQKRKELYQAQKKKREEERNLMQEDVDTDLIAIPKKNKPKKQAEPAVELSEEEKKRLSEQRKVERAQRFSQFKNILNSFVIQESSESSSSQSESDSKDSLQGQKITKNKSQETAQKLVSDDNDKQRHNEDEDKSVSCSQSMQECLQALNPYDNPWAKKL